MEVRETENRMDASTKSRCDASGDRRHQPIRVMLLRAPAEPPCGPTIVPPEQADVVILSPVDSRIDELAVRDGEIEPIERSDLADVDAGRDRLDEVGGNLRGGACCPKRTRPPT